MCIRDRDGAHVPSFLSTYAVSTVLYVEGPRETPSLYPPRPIGGDTMPARRNRNSTLRCDADQIEREAKRLVDTYSDLILRLCYSALGSDVYKRQHVYRARDGKTHAQAIAKNRTGRRMRYSTYPCTRRRHGRPGRPAASRIRVL